MAVFIWWFLQGAALELGRDPAQERERRRHPQMACPTGIHNGCVKKTRFAALPEWASMEMQPHSGAWHFLTFFIAP